MPDVHIVLARLEVVAPIATTAFSPWRAHHYAVSQDVRHADWTMPDVRFAASSGGRLGAVSGSNVVFEIGVDDLLRIFEDEA